MQPLLVSFIYQYVQGKSRSDSQKQDSGHSEEPPMGQEVAVAVPKAGNERLKQVVPSMSYHV